MKKRVIVSIILLFAFLFTSAVGFAVTNLMEKKHPSDYNIGIKYVQALESDKPSVVLFYADWCTYCLKFMPRYKILSMVYKDRYNFVMVDCDDSSYARLINDMMISGFPTVYIIDPKYDNRVHLTQGLYVNTMKFREELDRYLRIREMLDRANFLSDKK